VGFKPKLAEAQQATGTYGCLDMFELSLPKRVENDACQ